MEDLSFCLFLSLKTQKDKENSKYTFPKKKQTKKPRTRRILLFSGKIAKEQVTEMIDSGTHNINYAE